MASYSWPPLIIEGSGSGIASINGDTTAAQVLAVGTSGTDFALVDNGTGTHTFNLPNAGASARGVVSTGTQTLAGAKTFSSSVSLGADLLFTGNKNLGVQDGQLSGTDYRAKAGFFSQNLVVGNLLNASPPYGLNNSVLAGTVIAGNALANVGSLIGASAVFNSVSQGFIGFGKDGAFANVTAFTNSNDASDFDVYFSKLHLSSAASQLIKFSADLGSITLLKVTGGVDGALYLGDELSNGYGVSLEPVSGNAYINAGAPGSTGGAVGFTGHCATASFQLVGDDVQSTVFLTTYNSAPLHIEVDGTYASCTKQVRVASLGVGNSASATVAVGTLAKKIEVFDASGSSLGYIPVYATIT